MAVSLSVDIQTKILGGIGGKPEDGGTVSIGINDVTVSSAIRVVNVPVTISGIWKLDIPVMLPIPAGTKVISVAINYDTMMPSSLVLLDVSEQVDFTKNGTYVIDSLEIRIVGV